MTDRFALVADPGTVSSIAGRRMPEWAACAVDGSSASLHFADSRSEILEAVAGYPVSPSGYRSETAYPDFESEALALGMLADEIASRVQVLPEGFRRGAARCHGPLRVRITPYGLDVSITSAGAAAAGWKEGTTLAIAISHDGRLISLVPGGDAMLEEDEAQPGCLSTDRHVTGMPLWIGLGNGHWERPEFEVRDGSVIFVPPELRRPVSVPMEEHVHDVETSGSVAMPTVRDRRSCLAKSLVLVTGGIGAGFLAAAIWL